MSSSKSHPISLHGYVMAYLAVHTVLDNATVLQLCEVTFYCELISPMYPFHGEQRHCHFIVGTLTWSEFGSDSRLLWGLFDTDDCGQFEFGGWVGKCAPGQSFPGNIAWFHRKSCVTRKGRAAVGDGGLHLCGQIGFQGRWPSRDGHYGIELTVAKTNSQVWLKIDSQ